MKNITRAALGLLALSSALFAGGIASVPEESVNSFPAVGQADSRPDTMRFHSYARMMREIDSMVARYPEIAAIETIAVTRVGRRPVVAVRVTNNQVPSEPRPAILFNGVHHGCEMIGAEICLALLTSLLENRNQPEVRRIIDSVRTFIVPMVNPDGHEINISGADTWWRKNARDNNGNGYFDHGDGVDLNRNYPFNWDIGGESLPAGREYRGPDPLSEEEPRALADLTAREKFLIDICWHADQDYAQGEKIYYPWLWGTTRSPDYDFIRPIAESLAGRIVGDSGAGTYLAAPGYATSGGMYRNWSYYSHGVFSYTIEVGHGYYPPASAVDSICARVLKGANYALNRVLGTGLRGQIRDSASGRALAAQVTLLEIDTASAQPILPRSSDPASGWYYRLVNPGAYHLEVTCPGYRSRIVGPVPVVAGISTRVDVSLAAIAPGWSELVPLPVISSNRAVKSGGWLVGMAADAAVYAARGNRGGDFYRYRLRGNAWEPLESLPRGEEGKPPYKGAVGTADGSRFIYATKGNNTQGLWRYDILGDVWQQLPNIPLEPDGKKLKGGTGAAYVAQDSSEFLYLLKGYRNSFYRYNVMTGTWDVLAPAPGFLTKWKDGSWLAFDGSRSIYAHKAYYHELYRFDTRTGEWDTAALSAMPLSGRLGRMRKSKDGGSSVFSSNRIYALKGGNTEEFWSYDPAANQWQELDSLPSVGSTGRKRRVKDGAAIAALGNASFVALKGNKTREFWFYQAPPISPVAGGDGGQLSARASSSSRLTMKVLPNPVADATTIYFHLPQAGGVSLQLFDVGGRVVRTLVSGWVARGDHMSAFRAQGTTPVPRGVYLLKLRTGTGSVTRKLVFK